MKYDITIFPGDLNTDIERAKSAESMGFDGFWTAEADHNPFLPLTLAASATEKLTLGTQIAVAFPRSPMVTAQTAWDIASQSNGRFILGLGTQVRAHITRRFSMGWSDPVGRMREYIESLRAIWDTFQHDARLRYRGEYYTFRLMAPFFNPGPIEHPNIPIFIAGVNQNICQLAGEVCDGLHAHAFHTERYLKEVVLENVAAGLDTSGRNRGDFQLVVPVFTVTGLDDEAVEKAIIETKSRIAFYASTPSYKAVMHLHGWHDMREKLSQMARAGQWNTMWREISDEMLHEIAVVAKPDALMREINKRYEGIADRICLSWENGNPQQGEVLQQIAASMKG